VNQPEKQINTASFKALQEISGAKLESFINFDIVFTKKAKIMPIISKIYCSP
jgi:hypothetical protein